MADGRKVKDVMREEWQKLVREKRKREEQFIVEQWNKRLLDKLFLPSEKGWMAGPSSLDRPIEYSSTMPSSAMIPTSMFSSAISFDARFLAPPFDVRFLAEPEPFQPPPKPEPRQRKPTKKEVDQLAKSRRKDGRLKRVLDLDE